MLQNLYPKKLTFKNKEMRFKILLAITISSLFFSCTQTDESLVTISGTITNPKSDTVEIRLQDTTYFSTLDATHNFNISFHIDTASYLSFIHGEESTAMYLNGDENVKLTIDTELFDETIKYEGSATSSYLATKYMMSEKANIYRLLMTTEKEEFMLSLEEYIKAIENELSNIQNANFVALEKETNQQMLAYYSKQADNISKLPKKGEPAIDFTYPDKEGNIVSLSTFEGSLVYVDVWATWCAPCRAEIPALKQLEADYHHMNIIFMSVSVDRDKQKWLNMLEDKQLGGVQLWADGWSKITESYAINSIPRFMLFDSEGNIISLNAPRPSSEGIRELFDTNL